MVSDRQWQVANLGFHQCAILQGTTPVDLDRGEVIHRFGDCELDVRLHELRRGGERRDVEPQVFKLLQYLIDNRERLVGKDELIEIIWQGRSVTDSSLSTAIKLARQAVGDNGRRQDFIRTVPRRGFRFVGQIESRQAPDARASEQISIAVLPFINMSNDSEQEFFADGITDDLITHLSKLDGLLVISRNSVFTYKGRTAKARQIAHDLSVKYVLEGSIRRAGGQIRINVQLIDAERDVHVWADIFDGAAEDVFSLHDDVMGRIVSALEITLSPEERAHLADPPTSDPAAYEFYLRAREAHYTHLAPPLQEALGLYRKAQNLDPAFADAYAGEAAACAWVMRYNLFQVLMPLPARQQAEEAISAALAADPGNVGALCARSSIQTTIGSHDEAILTARQAVGRNPNDAASRHTLAEALAVSGDIAGARAETEIALKLDPKPSTHDAFRVGQIFLFDRQYDRALEYFEDAIERDPEYFEAYNGIIAANAELNHLERAREAVEIRISQWPQYTWRAGWMHRQHWHADLLDRWTKAMRKAGAPDWPYGFQGDKHRQLTGEELADLLLGHRLEGKGQALDDFILDIDIDGRWRWRSKSWLGGSLDLTGQAWIEGDDWCFVWDGGLPQRPHRQLFYRNPSGSKAEKNEYIQLDVYELFWFSVVE
jgi:TolB-like protein